MENFIEQSQGGESFVKQSKGRGCLVEQLQAGWSLTEQWQGGGNFMQHWWGAGGGGRGLPEQWRCSGHKHCRASQGRELHKVLQGDRGHVTEPRLGLGTLFEYNFVLWASSKI